MNAATIDAYRAALEPELQETMDALRSIIVEAHPGLAERIKWNAPSFALGDDDRITLGIEQKGGVRVVLHRGAKAKDSRAFKFQDADRLAAWPAPDRGVLSFADTEAVTAQRDALRDLFTRWLAATA